MIRESFSCRCSLPKRVVEFKNMTAVCSGDVVADKYRVERLLGRGGMGYVVSARHLSLDELFAIKFLRRAATTAGARGGLADEDAVARFRREAKACAVLKNDHVARVFDVGVHGDEPFIVMEHLDGRDLGALTRDGRTVIKTGDACDYIIQACEGLAEAHALGIVHRDIKLPNLFLTKTSSGAPLLKVLDFGVSKTMAGSASAVESDMTHTATVLGSPKYMSPEQMNDPRHVDERTDIWSLGICLYRLLSGVAPFDADTIGRLCTMVLHEQPVPIADFRPDLGIAPHVEAVIATCLQKDRAYRFANVAELAAALAPFANDPQRAAEQTTHIASVLGVPVPPQGYLPPLPMEMAPRPIFHTTTSSLEGASAWAHNMVVAKRQARRGELILALAAGAAALALLVIGVSVFGDSSDVEVRRRGGSSTLPPAAAEPPPPPLVVTPPPTPILIAPPPETGGATPTPPPPPPPVVVPKRRPGAPNNNALPPIPGDRK
jgi:eukaryotic-like serine/threonine-protein kinase